LPNIMGSEQWDLVGGYLTGRFSAMIMDVVGKVYRVKNAPPQGPHRYIYELWLPAIPR